MLQRRFYTIASVVVFTILYSYTAVIVFIVLLLASLKWKRGMRHVMGAWAKSVFPIMGKKLHIAGKDHINRNSDYILLANHASLFDIIAIMTFYPNVSWFGHERLLRIPLFKRMLLMTDYIPMRMTTVTNTRRMLDQLVEKSVDRTVAIFPEGTRTLNGKLSPFYRGFIYLLRATEKDILPVTLNGFYKLKPKNRFYINFGSRLGVVIHAPINGKVLSKSNDQEIISQVRGIIESAAI